MRCLFLWLCILGIPSLSSGQPTPNNYPFESVQSSVQFKSRLQYNEQSDRPWTLYSSIIADSQFPRFATYYGVSPHIEFIQMTNHNTGDSIAQLTEATLEIDTYVGTLSVGDKRLSFNGGQFISDSSFNLIPRRFGQVSLTSNAFALYYLYQTSPPNISTYHHFNRGSIVASAPIINQPTFSLISQVFLLDGHSDTLFISPKWQLTSDTNIAANIALQQSPSIGKAAHPTKKAGYYDVKWTQSNALGHILFGTRFFSGGAKHRQFTAPFSSGHAWDGYLNVFQPMVANGFIHHFQSLWTTVHLNNVNNAAITISGYLFRHPSFSKNYGAEVNLAIKKTLMSPSIHWTYKLGHYFNGTDTKALENTAMWLDFSIAFDDL